MLKAHILDILTAAPASGMALAFLRVEIGVRLARRIGEGEFAQAVKDLKGRKFIEDAEAGLSDDPSIKLTAAGRKAAAAL